MTNFQVFKKILPFSLFNLAVSLVLLAAVAGISALGFSIGQGVAQGGGFPGAIIGLLIGLILLGLASHYGVFLINAAMISVVTDAVATGKVPEHSFKAGFKNVKERFGSLTLLYFVMSAIKGVFRQLGRAITRVGQAIGGDAGNTVGSVIDSIIQTVISYLCDCCLGWVLFRRDENPAKSACEGCVIFFKHGKTLAKNAGRIFGMGAASLIVVGGAFFGLSYLLFNGPFLSSFQALYAELQKLADEPLGFDSNVFVIFAAAISAVMLWSTVHSVFGHPFILVGVLRNFIESGKADMPKESEFSMLTEKSPKFNKLLSKANE